jgi:RimJ/RimL family protein N-acetyltransferase
MHCPAASLLPRFFPGGCLRRLRAADLNLFQAYRSLPELSRYQSWPAMDEAEALAFLVTMEAAPLFQPGQWGQLGIAELCKDALVGDIGIYVSDDVQTGEVGVTLAPSSQGRGVARAAVEQALQLLFIATSVSQVFGITDARNTRSIRLLEGLGFKCREIRNSVLRGEECIEHVFVLPRGTAGHAGGLDGDTLAKAIGSG